MVLLGTVTSSSGYKGDWVPYQLKEVTVGRYFKGGSGQTQTVKELGGELGDGTSVWVEDQPELSVGTTYLLFLSYGEDGWLYVVGGPQGAMPVREGVAENAVAALKVTDSGLVPVQAEDVRATGFQNRTQAMVNEPTEMEIDCFNNGTRNGFYTFNVAFKGISGEAEGISSEQKVGSFVWRSQPTYSPFVEVFYHNFTLSGSYNVSVDGIPFGSVDVVDPEPRLSLSWVSFPSYSLPSDLTVDMPITIRVGPIRPDQAGEYRAIAVVSPRTDGIEPFYASYASYSADRDWFTFNFVVREPGNYTVTIWQGGERQLTSKLSVYPQISLSNSPADPSSAAQLAEAARRAAQQASSTQADQDSTSAQSGSAWSSPWLVLPIVAVLALTAWFVFRVARR